MNEPLGYPETREFLVSRGWQEDAYYAFQREGWKAGWNNKEKSWTVWNPNYYNGWTAFCFEPLDSVSNQIVFMDKLRALVSQYESEKSISSIFKALGLK